MWQLPIYPVFLYKAIAHLSSIPLHGSCPSIQFTFTWQLQTYQLNLYMAIAHLLSVPLQLKAIVHLSSVPLHGNCSSVQCTFTWQLPIYPVYLYMAIAHLSIVLQPLGCCSTSKQHPCLRRSTTWNQFHVVSIMDFLPTLNGCDYERFRWIK